MSSINTLPLATGNTPLWRRVNHGNIRFSSDLKQPQDGALLGSSRNVASMTPRNFPVVAAEPEDARLTGMTRSLNRRLMGLNVRPAALADLTPNSTKIRPVRSTAATVRQVA